MTIEVELFDDLDAIARDAAGALDRSAQKHLYDRLDWFRLTCAHVLERARIVVARASDGDRRGWLFLIDRGGRRAEALASWYTLAFRPIFAGAPDAPTQTALIAAIGGALASHFDRISLLPVPGADAALLLDGLAAGGWAGRRQAHTANWRVAVRDLSFARYWAARPARLRNTVRRKSALTEVNSNIISDFDMDSWSIYEDIYAKSWKPAEGSPRFLRALAEQEGIAGTARLGILYDGAVPVAAQFWLVENGVATIHKLAHVDDARGLSPGTLLSAAMFEAVIDRDRPATIDFGTGDDPYKADWMDLRSNLYRLDFARGKSIAAIAWRVSQGVSRLVRRSGSANRGPDA